MFSIEKKRPKLNTSVFIYVKSLQKDYFQPQIIAPITAKVTIQ